MDSLFCMVNIHGSILLLENSTLYNNLQFIRNYLSNPNIPLNILNSHFIIFIHFWCVKFGAESYNFPLNIHDISELFFSFSCLSLFLIDSVKDGCKFFNAILCDIFKNLVRELGTRGERFIVVLKYSNRFELILFYEITEFLKIFLRFSWKTDDKWGTDKWV